MEKIVNVPYEKIGFNASELSKLSREEFKKHEGHHFAGDAKASDKLEEAYALIQEAVPPTISTVKASEKSVTSDN